MNGYNKTDVAMVFYEIPVYNFKVYADAQLVKGGEIVAYGLYFRRIKDSNGLSFYLFAFTPRSYCLFLFRNREYEFLLDYCPSEFISSDSINSLMVEMVGQRINLGVNGHILDTITDNSLTLPGHVGISVSKHGDSLSEVRFRDFRLYSLE